MNGGIRSGYWIVPRRSRSEGGDHGGGEWKGTTGGFTRWSPSIVGKGGPHEGLSVDDVGIAELDIGVGIGKTNTGVGFGNVDTGVGFGNANISVGFGNVDIDVGISKTATCVSRSPSHQLVDVASLDRWCGDFTLEKTFPSLSRLPSPTVDQVDASSSSDSDAEIKLISEGALSEGSGPSGEAYLENVIDGITLPLSQLKIDKQSEGSVDPSNVLSHDRPIVLPDQIVSKSQLWRSYMSKVDIWYGSYGSNMWKPRFLCYIEGGQVEGMKNPCRGSNDKTSPKGILWKVIPHQLFFGRSSSQTWGKGGVAFIHPKRNDVAKTYMCFYRITFEQFNDVLLQENCATQEMASPLFDLSALDFVTENKSMELMAVKGGWYSNVLYLGHEDSIPMLSMTCRPVEIERFKSGELPLHAPSKDYMNSLVKGLVEGKQLSEKDAVDYISSAKL
ncbi:hypothetical protein Taro_031515 [Colocasia esculenta]|uniref:Uncharacterized protein n=1 Tax=Colocasia esculenta TaxID=4460 RepID=A0A843W3D0_COLES|nr:hypothetical protein [Colocasia esculenta]